MRPCEYQQHKVSHSISTIQELLNAKLFISFSSFLRPRIWIDEPLDVIDGIFLLSTLSMKGIYMRCQGEVNSFDVYLKSAGDAFDTPKPHCSWFLGNSGAH